MIDIDLIRKNFFLLFTKEEIEEIIKNPDWDLKDRVHNWMNYVPDGIKKVWQELPFDFKLGVFLMAHKTAGNEEWD